MLGLSMAACTSHGPKAPAEYPSAPTDSTAVDEYFGHKVTDLYRPLENDTATATLQWVKAENAVTDAYLSAIPFRDKVRRRLSALADYRKTGLPWREKNGKYYYFANDGLQNQSVPTHSATTAQWLWATSFLIPRHATWLIPSTATAATGARSTCLT